MRAELEQKILQHPKVEEQLKQSKFSKESGFRKNKQRQRQQELSDNNSTSLLGPKINYDGNHGLCSGKDLLGVLTNQPGRQNSRYEYNHVLVQPEDISGGSIGHEVDNAEVCKTLDKIEANHDLMINYIDICRFRCMLLCVNFYLLQFYNDLWSSVAT